MGIDLELVKFFGLGGLPLIALFWVIRSMTKASVRRDDSAQELIEAQSLVISNHIDHSTRAISELSGAIKENTAMVKDVRDWMAWSKKAG